MKTATKIEFPNINNRNSTRFSDGWRNRSVLDYIGNTPIVHLKNINAKANVNLLAKLEFFNPGGSIKDRAALSMIEDAERSGELTKDKIVIEATSGNTGIGLALICAAKGYLLLLAMSEAASQERKKILKNYGAQLVLTPSSLSTDGAIEYIYDLYNQYPERYFLVDQFNNEMNSMAHYYTTAPEIWEQTNQEVTAVVCSLGTTGTVMGIAKRMKEYNPAIKIIAVEPYPGHKIQGLKNMNESYVPGIYDRSLLDRVINVSDEDCFAMLRRLTVEEGLFVGMSSGAAAVGALKYIEEISKGVVTVIFPDSGERYLSTPIYSTCMEIEHTDDVKTQQSAESQLEELHLFNTLTRQKEKLQSLQPNEIKMYTCGPTVDRLLDLHQMRRFVITDILRCYLEYQDFAVNHVVNVTDIDDKTIRASKDQDVPLAELTEQYFDEFQSDLERLQVKKADRYCRYSENAEDMIALTKKLYEKGLAYEKHRSIYFDVSRYKQYGIFLNGLKAADMDKLGALTEDPDKKYVEDPMDFTLFKRATLYELKKGIYYKTEWGNGRPSWHIGCAAIATKHLGNTYDIHTSSSMHMYPHNENTIATACAPGEENLANYWVHVAPILVNQVTMNEKVENIITVRELLQNGYSERQLRYFFLSANYREPLHYSEQTLQLTCQELEKLDERIEQILVYEPENEGAGISSLIDDALSSFEAALNNDLDVVNGVEILTEFINDVTPLVNDALVSLQDQDAILGTLGQMNAVLKILALPKMDPEITKNSFTN